MLNLSDLDSQFRALAEPTRRSIIERLGRGPATVSGLAEPFDMSLAAIVQHLKVLEDVGLIRTEKIGRVRTCQIVPAGFQGISDWIAERRSLVEKRLDRLGVLLTELETNPIPTPNEEGKSQ